MKNLVVGLGEILWDEFPDKKILGGAPANFAYHSSQLGCESYVVSAIGKDPSGQEILDVLADKNLGYVIETSNYPTGKVRVSLNKDGIPCYEISENVAWDNIPFSNQIQNLARKTQIVCFGSLAQRSEVSRNTINYFLDAMPPDSLKIFDINLRQHFYKKETIHNSLIKANVLKINDEEFIVLSDLFGYEKPDETKVWKAVLTNYNLDILILTKGINGSFVFTREEMSYLPTPKIQVADTVGAGDAFTAAFIVSYQHGKSIEEAHCLAVDLSAYVCTQYGAMPLLPIELRKLWM